MVLEVALPTLPLPPGMHGKKKAVAPKAKPQKTLASAGFYPMLAKTTVALGKYATPPGSYWQKCPAADKKKRYKCMVVEFVAMHDFDGGVKGAAFKCKEMGEDGKGSLEPGVASGEEYMLAYPTPFLEYYYYENRSELSEALRKKLFPEEGTSTDDTNDAPQADATEDSVVVKQETQRPPIFDYLERVSSTLNISRPTSRFWSATPSSFAKAAPPRCTKTTWVCSTLTAPPMATQTTTTTSMCRWTTSRWCAGAR